MSPENKLKEVYLRHSIEKSLSALPPGAAQMLASQVSRTESGRAHVLGTDIPAPSAAELLDELWRTPVGITLKELLAEGAANTESSKADSREAELARIQQLPPAQRIEAARRAGLAY